MSPSLVFFCSASSINTVWPLGEKQKKGGGERREGAVGWVNPQRYEQRHPDFLVTAPVVRERPSPLRFAQLRSRCEKLWTASTFEVGSALRTQACREQRGGKNEETGRQTNKPFATL